MSSRKKLEDYRAKRDFKRTSEPSGAERIEKGDAPHFVIQKHQASTLHYDFRLEIGDVLVSWAVPKGPSTDPNEKRLALRTEDHPLAYGNFEGVIPEGQYGAGTVMLWDRGTYRNIRAEKKKDSTSMEKALKEGKIEVWLQGKKLEGGYVLIRTDMEGQEKWLLKKMDDEKADARRNPVSTQDKSVQSGLTLKQIESKADES